jgi:limonene-1,2-epoxide hydrolase
MTGGRSGKGGIRTVRLFLPKIQRCGFDEVVYSLFHPDKMLCPFPYRNIMTVISDALFDPTT